MGRLLLLPLLLPGAMSASAADKTGSLAVQVQVELQTKINTKTAKPGQKVTVKTISPLTLPNGKTIPLASEIYGRVTEVSNDDSGATLAIAFTQMEINNRKTPLIFSLRAVLGLGTAADDTPGGIRPSDVFQPELQGAIRDLGQTTATLPPTRALRQRKFPTTLRRWLPGMAPSPACPA